MIFSKRFSNLNLQFSNLNSQFSNLNLQKRFKFQKADTFCFLLQDSKLGRKGDIIQVSQEKARNLLVPLQLAYYVPRIRGKPLLPENWEPSIDTSEIQLETITPAFTDLTESEINEIISKTFQKHENYSEILKTDPKIQIYSKGIPGTNKLFGSVGKEDVLKEISRKFQSISLESCQISFLEKYASMDRIKESGLIPFKITFDGQEVEMVLEILKKTE